MICLSNTRLLLRAGVLISALLCSSSSWRLLAQPQGSPPNPVRPDYVLGSEDQVIIHTAQVPEINDRPFRIDTEGFMDLPIVGRVKAGGLTVRAFENSLLTKLREFVVSPQIFVTLVQLRGDPVFFVGAFRTPGIYPLSGRHTLIEMLTSVGGLQPNASRRIKISRRTEYGTVPLANAVESPDKKISSVEINFDSLSESVNPEEDIVLQPYDIISAERSEKIYVTGAVARPTGIELGERTSLSIAQAITEAGGFTPAAKRSQVKILRLVSGTNRRSEVPVNVDHIIAGKAKDFPLLPNDVLYIPHAVGPHAVLTTAIPAMVASLPWLLISFAR